MVTVIHPTHQRRSEDMAADQFRELSATLTHHEHLAQSDRAVIADCFGSLAAESGDEAVRNRAAAWEWAAAR